jgi:hypothetical protein
VAAAPDESRQLQAIHRAPATQPRPEQFARSALELPGASALRNTDEAAGMGIDRWEFEHRNYRPGRPVTTEVTPEDRLLDVPEDLPIEDMPTKDLLTKDSPIPQPAPAPPKRSRTPKQA